MANGKVFIGVGHGGSDPGAVGYVVEKTQALKIAKYCYEYLRARNVDCVMSRSTDVSESLNSKIAECNSYKPDLAMDIHLNAAAGGGGDGFEVFHTINGGTGKILAQKIEAEVVKIGQNSRGIKTKKGTSGDYYAFIRQTNAPAIILEGAFVDNKADASQVDTDAECKAFGEAYAKGVIETLKSMGKYKESNIIPTTSSTTPSVTPSTRTLNLGCQGSDVKELQNNLNSLGYSCGTADGVFGAKTNTALKNFQKACGLVADGIYGNNSKKKMNEALTKKNSSNSIATPSKYDQKQFIKDVQTAIGVTPDSIVGSKTLSALPTVSKSKNITHKVVKPLQKYLNALGYNCGAEDGIAGSKFDSAVKSWQKANGCVTDGEFTKGSKSWKRILGVA